MITLASLHLLPTRRSSDLAAGSSAGALQAHDSSRNARHAELPVGFCAPGSQTGTEAAPFSERLRHAGRTESRARGGDRRPLPLLHDYGPDTRWADVVYRGRN